MPASVVITPPCIPSTVQDDMAQTTSKSGDPFVKDILIQFFRDIDYVREDPIPDDNVSYLALKKEFSPYNTGRWFDALCRRCALVAELTYRGHSDDVRIIVSRCTWFLLYIDDGRRFPDYLMDFQKRVLTETTNSPQDDFFKAHRDFLTDFYQLFDPVVANCIILSCLDFVNGCVLEEMQTIRSMKLTEASQSWPYFLRKKTGHAHAYAFMLFPKEAALDMSTYIHAVDDMVDFINLANDILSFYKEDLAGEKNNYVHNRAFVTKKTVQETLQDIANEALAANNRTIKALESTSSTIALEYWKQYVNGYVEFHFIEPRYRLQELKMGYD